MIKYEDFGDLYQDTHDLRDVYLKTPIFKRIVLSTSTTMYNTVK